MSTTYSVVSGDTFDAISRKIYGTAQEGGRIARTNPGANEPLSPGVTLSIPVIPDAPKNIQQRIDTADIDETAILINGVRFRFWESVRIVRSLDGIDTVEFSAPFDFNAPGFKDIFRPVSYKSVDVTIGGNSFFTGTMIPIDPLLGNIQKTISVGCYSLPGVLNDCTPPASVFSLEFNGQGLKDIMTSMVEPFGIAIDFRVNQGPVFEQVASATGKKILAFFIELAQQRNLILTNSKRGELVVWQSIEPGNPVAKLRQGESPLLSVTPLFNPQNYYSHITGINPEDIGLNGSQYTVKNPHLSGIVRPLTFEAPDTDDSTIKAAVEAKMGRMFGDLVSYSISVDTWRDFKGNLWEPNTTITLFAPNAMIYTEYEFIIRSIEFRKDKTTKTATLNVVLPGSFSGKIPETLPWD